jgi:2-amino-4-hydroxy-6-hydroxymethyldihydropteridine diphosphokinase
MPIGDGGARIGDPAREWPGVGAGVRMQDADGDRSHLASLSVARTGACETTMIDRRVRAYLGLGANLGDPAATLAEAVRALALMPGIRLRAVSRLYATEPVGVTDQPEFRNAAVAVDVSAGADPVAGALALLTRLKDLERDFGRRQGTRWGPRELDIDLLVLGRARISVERPLEARSVDADHDPAKASKLLEVPHREARRRLFVLAPLADLAPGLAPPGWGETVETARRRQVGIEGADAARPIASWDADAMAWRQLGLSPR